MKGATSCRIVFPDFRVADSERLERSSLRRYSSCERPTRPGRAVRPIREASSHRGSHPRVRHPLPLHIPFGVVAGVGMCLLERPDVAVAASKKEGAAAPRPLSKPQLRGQRNGLGRRSLSGARTKHRFLWILSLSAQVAVFREAVARRTQIFQRGPVIEPRFRSLDLLVSAGEKAVRHDAERPSQATPPADGVQEVEILAFLSLPVRRLGKGRMQTPKTLREHTLLLRTSVQVGWEVVHRRMERVVVTKLLPQKTVASPEGIAEFMAARPFCKIVRRSWSPLQIRKPRNSSEKAFERDSYLAQLQLPDRVCVSK